MADLKSIIQLEKLPKHIAIIMDGNGRWAKEKGEDRLYGHYHGIESVRNIVEGCAELGISFLTLYAFSTENWNRPENEVTALMELLISTIRNEIETLQENSIKLHVIGDLKMLPGNAKKELDEAINLTKNNYRLNLIMALSYSGRWDIIQATQSISKKVLKGDISSDNIDDNLFQKHLSTQKFPDPELLIRTSGEYRISNFLLYQLAYTELYITDVFWPEFRKKNLYTAILDYQKRERRFGKTSEQTSK